MRDVAQPDEDLVRRLPLPLAQLYRRAHNAKTALERHLTAYYLWEAALKLLTSAAVVEYAELPEHDPQLAERLRSLARPSLGHWWEFARRLLPVLADRGDAGFGRLRDWLLGKTRDDLPRAAGLDAVLREALEGQAGARSTVRLTELLDRLVRYRNQELGHGAAGRRPEEFYGRVGDALLAGLGELLGRVDVLAGRRLLYVGEVRQVAGEWLVHRYELTGETARRVESLTLPMAETGRLPFAEDPDLDGAIAAYMATEWLATGTFPPAADALARYADAVDAGRAGMDPGQPFALYAAFAVLKHRLALSTWDSREDAWREAARLGMRVVDHVAREAAACDIAIMDADAFRAPGLFSHLDRREVQTDRDRYQRKLADPACHARRALVRLPGIFGGATAVPALLVRDVQNDDDPDRCVFLKDWARADAARCADTAGFVALVVSTTPTAERLGRSFLSVRPGASVTLQGLGAALEQAEAARRIAAHGFDDRVQDPATGKPLAPRPGYANADPWYDGRAHEHTIVDAPRSGTRLTPDEVEALFLSFGRCEAEEVQPV